MKKLTLLLSAMLLACATSLRAEVGTTSTDTLFHESFGSNTGKARDWNDEYSVKSGVAAVYQNATYSTENVKQGKNTTGQTGSGLNQSVANTDAVFIVGPLSVADYQNLGVTYYWKAGSIKETYTTNLYYSTDNKEYTEVTKTSGEGATTFVQCVYSLPEAAQSNNLYLKVVFNTSNTQAIIDEFVLMGESASTATLQSIEITGTPDKTNYMAGEAFSTNGLKVMGNYDNATQKEITEGITWTVTPATLTAGLTQVSVTATAEGKSTTRTITGLTVTAAKTLTSIAVSGTPAEFWKGDTFNHNGMTVTAKWDDNSTTDVTAEATFSTPDMTTAGTKTITVTYKEKTATYDITVNTIANTQETAYTTTQAIALIDAGKDLTANVYVKGTISQIDGYSSGTITYWLDQHTFEVFKGKNLNNTNFTAVDDVVKGAEVIVYGQITKFGSTYEFNTGNYLASYTAPAVVKQDPTLTLGTYKTSMDANEVNDEYSVTYDGDGTLSVTSSNEEVAMVTIDGTNIVVDALTEGTTTISVSAAETDTYYFVEKKYTLTVYPAWVATSLPFEFDGGKNDINQGNGMKQNGIENKDYSSSPKLKFGETDASLIIWFNETAASVSYAIKGNPPTGTTTSGTFDVLESEDNQKYTALATYVNLTTTKLTETKTLSSSTRYIKFVYSNKVSGNVALGAIKIAKPSTPSAINNAAVEISAVKTIENGQLIILRDGVKYNAMGVRLQ